MKNYKTTMNLSKDKYMETAYPETGFYRNTDEGGLVEWFFMNKETGIVGWAPLLMGGPELDVFFSTPEVNALPYEVGSGGTVSENFALKAMLIAQMKGELKDIE